MASIAAAAAKSVKERMSADHMRIKVGHMLTFETLIRDNEMVERNIGRRVLRRNILRSTGCLALPLTIMYFVFYVLAIRLHEDITGVFFLESTIRHRIDNMFIECTTVEDFWNVLTTSDEQKFLDVFAHQTDDYGGPQLRSVSDEVYGNWGLVEGFNQIQGAIRFQQWRKSSDDFGKPYTCDDEISCKLCRENQGFQTNIKKTTRPPVHPDCGSWSGRRLGTSPSANQDLDIGNATERRLKLQRPETRSSFPLANDLTFPDDLFQFWLYPSETRAETRRRLSYFKERKWIDGDTHKVEIRMYLMNAELGRTRLEQLTMTFRISDVGSVYYARDMQTIFLTFWQSSASMLADFCFLVMLLATTCYRVWQGWKAFLTAKLFLHLLNIGRIWEWLMILIGWWNMYGFYKMRNGGFDMTDALEPVHSKGWDLGADDLPKVVNLFEVGGVVAHELASFRVVFAQYSLVLMFRFFASFGTQPRLAIVLRTMQNVLIDFYHFLLVFVPTFMGYAVMGCLLFGRRLEAFITIQGSFGALFRIAMENEYDWEDMSATEYWASAIWCWSFLLLAALLFLNMVLAMILDVYNETRESNYPGEAVWETFSQLSSRTKRWRTWVPERVFESSLGNSALSEKCMITRKDLTEEFPSLPDKQKELFFGDCHKEMMWESRKDLTVKNLLKLVGSIMDGLDVARKATFRLSHDKDSVVTWATPSNPSSPTRAAGEPSSLQFLRPNLISQGRQHAKFENNSFIGDKYCNSDEEYPEWLQDTWKMLKMQRIWIDHANWNMQMMHWQISKAIQNSTPQHRNIVP